MNTKLMFSSNTGEWSTPILFFKELDEEFHFDLDASASRENAKCKRYFTKEDDGLIQKWTGRVFVNPVYGREIGKWVKKASDSVREGDCETVVMLLPSRTDTRYFHEYIYHKAEIRFIKGRLKFGDGKNSAPFPSLLAIFRNNPLASLPDSR